MKANFIQNVVKSVKSVQVSTKYIFSQKCGSTVEANISKNVIRFNENRGHDVKYLRSEIKSMFSQKAQ